jgi:hypothetical protein
MIKHVAVIAGAFALVSTSALADDSANGSKLPPKALPTMKDKQRAVDAATSESSRQSREAESLGNRGPPRLEKNGTKCHRRKRTRRRRDGSSTRATLVLRAGRRGRLPIGADDKGQKAAVEAAEKDGTSKESAPVK